MEKVYNSFNRKIKIRYKMKKIYDAWFLKRTAADRRERYKMLRLAGFNSKTSYRVRDWRPNKIILFIQQYSPYYSPEMRVQISQSP